MSRIGKKVIEIPAGVEVSVNESTLTVKGPKGELARTLVPQVEVSVEGSEARVNPTNETREANALWGTFASHLQSMVIGVTEGFEKKLNVEGVGYKVDLKGSTLVLSVGFSHTVELEVPEGIAAAVEKNEITITGIDKHAVGQFAANIRAVKKPEPYKGKGIRYSDEVVRRKQGKRAA